MFKSKWQKKYEQAMENVEKWRKFYRNQADKFDDPTLVGINTAQAIALGDILKDMKKIAEL